MRGLPQKQNARRADKIRLCGHLGRYKKIVKKTYIILINNYIIATFDKNIINHVGIEEVKIILDTFMEKPYIQEIYTMDKEETPLLYALGIKKDFKTLKILSSGVVKEE